MWLSVFNYIYYAALLLMIMLFITRVLGFRKDDSRTFLPLWVIGYALGYYALCSMLHLPDDLGYPFFLFTLGITSGLYALCLRGSVPLKILLIIFCLNMIISENVLCMELLLHLPWNITVYVPCLPSVLNLLLIGLFLGIAGRQKPAEEISMTPFLWSIWILIFTAVFLSVNLWKSAAIEHFHETAAPMVQALVSLFLGFSMYLLFVRMVREFSERNTQQIRSQKLELQLQELNALSARSESYRRERHEWKNKLVYMKFLLQNDRTDDLMSLLSDVQSELEYTGKRCRCGSAAIDMVVNIKTEEARAKNIPALYDIYLEETLRIPESALCSLLLNMIDNAIEASEKEDQPDIYVKIRLIRNHFVVVVRNRTTVGVLSQNPQLKTTKERTEQHGIGIGILRQIAAEYNGSIRFREEDSFFIATAVLENTDTGSGTHSSPASRAQ